MSPFVAELVGTALLILLGNGVVAGVLLGRSKAQGAGWMVITTGWALAVFVGAYSVASISGAHLNPAVTVGLAAAGKFAWAKVLAYATAQLAGAMVGATLVWLHYMPHWAHTEDPNLKLAVFCTGPAIRHRGWNLVSETIGTFALVFGILTIKGAFIEGTGSSGAAVPIQLGALGILPVALLVWVIGLSLGGTTGYAINPARDLGPRLMHALLPIAGKRDSDWRYAWIPIVGPLLGAFIAARLYVALGGN